MNYPIPPGSGNMSLALWHLHFTLVVDDFGIKYVGDEHTHPLCDALKKDYMIEEDWRGGVTLLDQLKLELQQTNFGHFHANICPQATCYIQSPYSVPTATLPIQSAPH